MLVKINDCLYKFFFQYEDKKHKTFDRKKGCYGKKHLTRKNTNCFIMKYNNLEEEPEITVVGKSKCNLNQDLFNKDRGRVISLGRAISELIKVEYVDPEIFWATYYGRKTYNY